MYTPPVTSLQFSVLGPLNRPSLFDVLLDEDTTALFGPAGTSFDGWCLAMYVVLDADTATSGTIYSPYELGTLSAAGLPIGAGASALDNLDSINWLINDYNGTNYTWGEVQAAIWSLIGDNWTLFSNALGNPDPARVSALSGQALANDGFKPEAGQILGLVVDVRDASGKQQQPTLLEVRAAEMGDRVFEDKNANGVQDEGDLGIAGARVELVRDGNGDGNFDDLNEVLATATTDGIGDYSFKGLTPGADYQVRFVQPDGYDGASPRQAGFNRDFDSDGLVSDVQVLAPREYRSTVDSGFYKFAALGDRVWLDANGNGQQDSGEGGVANVVVNLINSAGNVIGTQTTAVGGTYLFTNLVPGSYSVEFVAPARLGFTATDVGDDVSDSDADQATGRTGTVTLESGQTNRTVDAGLVGQDPQPGRLSGTVFEDRDNNGSGDIPLGGVLIVLKTAAGVKVGRTTTAADGTYSFDNLVPGDYTVHQTNLTGYNDVGDKDGGDLNSIAATVPAGGQSTGNDFVDDRPASLGDQVWLDGNNNGQFDNDEGGVAGVTVKLLDSAGALVATQTTNSQGNYLFTGLDAGTYSVEFVKPANLNFTASNSGDDNSDSDAIQTTGRTGSYTLASGDDNRTVDAGLVQPPPPPGRLSGTVYEDRDNNGSGDIPLGGVLIVLKTAAGGEVSSTTTAPDGTYSFDNLVPGDYTVHQTNLTGYNDVGDKDGGDLNSIAATVPAGGQSTGNDFVDDRPASLGDQVWLDGNNNGQFDNDEGGVAGVTVKLLDSAGGTVATQTTNSQGNYLFTGLDAGTYSVKFVKPANLNFTASNSGDDNSDSDAIQTTGRTGSYTLASGDDNRTVDAGLVQPAPQPGRLSGTVFEDRDNNGSGDIPLGGVLIVLKTAAGGEVSSTTTAPDGTYSFGNLTPGNYTVHQTNLTGYNDVGDKDGGDLNSIAATVPAGGQSTGNDFVDDRPASLGDRVFLDSNGNGQQDGGEAGVVGVAVKLLNSAGNVVSTQATNGAGDYLFSNLDAGTYSVEFVKPTNLNFTTANVGNDGSDSDANSTTGRTGKYTLVSGETKRTVDAGLVAPATKVCTTVNLQGNSSLDGSDGNTRTWIDAATGVTISARAFSQAKGSGSFESAYLGAYGGGLGVTDRHEGNGDKNRHTVDNIDKNNYIVFQFSQAVTMDKVSLGSVVGDSDIQVWVSNSTGALTSLNSAMLSGASFTEVNTTTSGSARVADINANGVMGNIFILAADTTDTTAEDFFKLSHLDFCVLTSTPQPPPSKGSIGDRVWEDKNFNGVQDGGEAGVGGVTVKLLNSAGAVVSTTTSNSSGNYVFNGLDAGNYKVHVVSPSGYFVTKQDLGGNDGTDSDINKSGVTGTIALGAGQNITDVDAGIYRKASIGDKVFADWNHNGVQDAGGEGAVRGVKVLLQDSNGVTIDTTTTDKQGMYRFTDLDPGTYRIGFDKRHGVHVADNASVKNWQWSRVNVGTDDSGDSDATAAYNAVAYTGYTTLDSGEYDNTWDVGVTPIVIDLDGNGIQTISRSLAGGSFDLFGNGNAVQSGWISGGDGFLAVDVNGNGTIDSSAELFGGTAKGAGYAKLGSYDSNGDGMISMLDTDFAKLLVWQDGNGNHQTDDGELMTLAQAGVTSLSLNLVEQNFYVDSEGNVHGETSHATLANGQSVTMTDVYFSVDKADAVAAGAAMPTIGELLGTGESELDALMGASAASATTQPVDDCFAETGELLRKLSALSRADMEQQASLAH